MRWFTRFGLGAALLASAASAIGCGGSLVVDYSTVAPALNYSGRRAVAVAVQDARPRIVSGQAEPTAVGETRAVGGKQAHLLTGDGRTLAALTADAVAGALRDKGFDAKIVAIDPTTDRAAAEQALLAGKPDYAFLLTINKWWSALHKRSVLAWDLVLDVYDADGQRIAQSTAAGEQPYDEQGAPIVAKIEESSDWGEAPAPEPEPAAPPVTTEPPPAATEPPPATSDPEAFGDPDAFGGAAAAAKPAAGKQPAPAKNAAPEKAPEPAPEPEPEDPHATVLRHVVASYEARLAELLNNPDIPREMTRFDTGKMTGPVNPLAPQSGPLVDDVSQGSPGAPPPPPPPD
jgi:hypothetical protein